MVTYSILVEWTWESLFFTHKTRRFGRRGGAPSPKCFPNVSSSTVQRNREDGRTEIRGEINVEKFWQVYLRPRDGHSEGFVNIRKSTNVNPEKGPFKEDIWIWTNHQISGDILVFRGITILTFCWAPGPALQNSILGRRWSNVQTFNGSHWWLQISTCLGLRQAFNSKGCQKDGSQGVQKYYHPLGLFKQDPTGIRWWYNYMHIIYIYRLYIIYIFSYYIIVLHILHRTLGILGSFRSYCLTKHSSGKT